MKNILFDFDGVIADSMSVRLDGFRKVVEFVGDEKTIDEFILYCHKSAGISRYEMFRYLYENMLKTEVSDKRINELAFDFSHIMKQKMTDKKILIKETIDFIKDNYKRYNLHIISGSDGDELRFLCSKLGITSYFISILGSPTPKDENIKLLLKKHDYDINETVYVGDSVNDYKASKKNGLFFLGYNNIELEKISDFYIKSFKKFSIDSLHSS